MPEVRKAPFVNRRGEPSQAGSNEPLAGWFEADAASNGLVINTTDQDEQNVKY